MTEPSHSVAKSADAKQNAKAAGKPAGGLGEAAQFVGLVLLAVVVFRTIVFGLLFQPFNIPSGSMIPTLRIGDYLFVSKYAYGYSNASVPSFPWLPISIDLFSGRVFAAQPKRGDVVVFKLPRDRKTDYIKRVIGLPGDRIQLRQGRLYINDKLVPREPIAEIHTEDFYGRDVDVPTYREILPGGASHTIIEIQGDSGFADNTEVFEVPPNDYFMMGDNRDNSMDSRVASDQGGVGYVPFENLVGRAEMIAFTLDKDEPIWAVWEWPRSLRLGRMFKLVK